MRYFIVRPNIDDIRKFPQTRTIVQANYNSKHNTRFATYSTDYIPQIKKVEVERGALVTDIIFPAHIGSYYFFSCSSEVYDQISTLNLSSHKTYSLSVWKSNKKLQEYVLVHIQIDVHKYVDFSESLFLVVNKKTKESFVTKFSPKKYQLELDELYQDRTVFLKPKSLIFKDDFNLDMFSSVHLRLPLTVSDTFIDKVYSHEFTGVSWNLNEPIGQKFSNK